MSPNLAGKICVVTGATKGIGKGIAVQLGAAGAKVYITGRTKDMLDDCAAEIRERGGTPIPVQVDHSNDKEVEALFQRIKREQNGRLDVLVNNAYAGVHAISSNQGKPFFTLDPIDQWDAINGVGLRGHYLCTVYGSRMMVENKTGLIINVSSPGGLRYLFNVAYGIGKAACDRMAADCAVELKNHNVAMISLWPGPVKTEYVVKNVTSSSREASAFENAESMEFAGKAIANLAADPNYISKTGRILFTCDLAKEYDFVDDDGDIHDIRSLSRQLSMKGHTWLAAVTPSFIRVPLTVMHYASYKF